MTNSGLDVKATAASPKSSPRIVTLPQGGQAAHPQPHIRPLIQSTFFHLFQKLIHITNPQQQHIHAFAISRKQ
jgi:hypothetical protein